jgi:hypothetical protein
MRYHRYIRVLGIAAALSMSLGSAFASTPGSSAVGGPRKVTLSKAEFDQRMGQLPINSPARRSRAFCRTLGPEEWGLVFPESPSEYGGTVCYLK